MRHLQLTASLCALVLLSGCATTEPPRLENLVNPCGIADVTYCVGSPGGVKQCTCIDAREMAYGSGGMFGH